MEIVSRMETPRHRGVVDFVPISRNDVLLALTTQLPLQSILKFFTV